MKLLICIDNTDFETEHDVREAYRMIDWPAVPNVGDDIFPFDVNDMDAVVESCSHHFKDGYVLVSCEEFTSAQLKNSVLREKELWVISTRAKPLSSREVAKLLMSS
jgi:hypothetical protein